MNYLEVATKVLAEHRFAERTLKKERKVLKAAGRKLDAAQKAQKVVQEAAKRCQEKANARITHIVTRCLDAVFGQDNTYRFDILFEKKRGKTEARMVFMDGDKEVHPTAGAGGGKVDVAALALRIAAVMITRPLKRRLLILDEPFRMVSEEYVPAMAKMLDTLAIELNFQFVVVTHHKALRTGHWIEL